MAKQCRAAGAPSCDVLHLDQADTASLDALAKQVWPAVACEKRHCSGCGQSALLRLDKALCGPGGRQNKTGKFVLRQWLHVPPPTATRTLPQVLERWGAVDVLVNNAGISEGGSDLLTGAHGLRLRPGLQVRVDAAEKTQKNLVEEHVQHSMPCTTLPCCDLSAPILPPHSAAGDPDGWDRTIDINLLGPMRLTARLAPAMAARGGVVIINTGSLAGTKPMEKNLHYAASKWGVRGWTLACYEVRPGGG